MVYHLPPSDVLVLGLKYVGFREETQISTCLATKTKCFLANYGTNPATLSRIVSDLQSTHIPAARVDNLGPKDLLMAVHFMSGYDNEPCLAGRFGMNEKTVRVKVKKIARHIQALKNEKVSSLWFCGIWKHYIF